jgi:hypothetical protein
MLKVEWLDFKQLLWLGTAQSQTARLHAVVVHVKLLHNNNCIKLNSWTLSMYNKHKKSNSSALSRFNSLISAWSRTAQLCLMTASSRTARLWAVSMYNNNCIKSNSSTLSSIKCIHNTCIKLDCLPCIRKKSKCTLRAFALKLWRLSPGSCLFWHLQQWPTSVIGCFY